MSELTAEVDEHWTRYLEAEDRGQRSDALAQLADVVDALRRVSAEERNVWAMELAVGVADGQVDLPLRMPLWVDVIVPALLDGLARGDGAAHRACALLFQRLAKGPTRLAVLPSDLRHPMALLERALEIDPDDARSGLELVGLMARYLDYAVHEVPVGVLWDTSSATAAQCGELLDDLSRFRQLSQCYTPDADYSGLVERCQFHFEKYRDYLESEAVEGYGFYLEAMGGPEWS